VKLYIPTYQRGTALTTLASLHPRLLEKVVIVIRETESSVWENSPYQILKTDVLGIAATRQFILDHTKEEHVCLVDDDLRFAKRFDNESRVYLDQRIENQHLYSLQAYNQLRAWLLEGIVHCGLTSREGNNRTPLPHMDNTRSMRVLAFNAPIVKDAGVRFDRVALMEDFDFTLQLLRMHHSNRISTLYMSSPANTSNSPGGCSEYRAPAVQAEAAHTLKKLHPDFVTVVTKKTKTAWKNAFTGKRVDVRIALKKAFGSPP